jgi:hypothetical protein
MKDLLMCDGGPRRGGEELSRIEIPIIPREVAAGDLNSYAMIFTKNIAGGPELHLDLYWRLFRCFWVAPPYYSIG